MCEGGLYVPQLKETCRLVAEGAGRNDWELVFQSRSGPPAQPWLEPDVCDRLRQLAAEGVKDVTVVPIGFISDHMEVLYDLDTEAQALAKELGMNLTRAATVGHDPRFIRLIRDLVLERMDASKPREALGVMGPSHDVCPADCCPAPKRPRVS